jgi:hypothetical protein
VLARWARMLPHLLALDPAASSSPDVRNLACDATWYLGKRGAAHASRDLAERLYQQWGDRLGPDHHDTLHAASNLASALGELGRDRQARDDHPMTLGCASNLAVDLCELGKPQEARELEQDTFSSAGMVACYPRGRESPGEGIRPSLPGRARAREGDQSETAGRRPLAARLSTCLRNRSAAGSRRRSADQVRKIWRTAPSSWMPR